MTNSNELPPIEVPELPQALQAHLDRRAGAPGVNGLERYVVVLTYVREDGTAGLEVVTNVHDVEMIVDTLSMGLRCVEPSLPRYVETTTFTDTERRFEEVTPDNEAHVEARRYDRAEAEHERAPRGA